MSEKPYSRKSTPGPSSRRQTPVSTTKPLPVTFPQHLVPPEQGTLEREAWDQLVGGKWDINPNEPVEFEDEEEIQEWEDFKNEYILTKRTEKLSIQEAERRQEEDARAAARLQEQEARAAQEVARKAEERKREEQRIQEHRLAR
jgi:hypothetical protein